MAKISNDLGSVEITGKDTVSFLDNILINRVSNRASGSIHLNGFSSIVGKLIASFIVITISDEEMIIVMDPDLTKKLIDQMSRYVLRSKVHIQEIYAKYYFYTSIYKDLSIAENALVFNLENKIKVIVSTIPIKLPINTWRSDFILSGIHITNFKTSEMYYPQNINYDLCNGVSFNKGCYLGQEAIAKMQYKGLNTIRAKSFFAHRNAPEQLETIYCSGTTAGEVLDSVNYKDGCILSAAINTNYYTNLELKSGHGLIDI